MNAKLGVKVIPSYNVSDKIPFQIADFNDSSKHNDILLTIGPYIYQNPVLLYQIPRIMKSHIWKRLSYVLIYEYSL